MSDLETVKTGERTMEIRLKATGEVMLELRLDEIEVYSGVRYFPRDTSKDSNND